MHTLQATIGILFLVGMAYAASSNRQAINWRIVIAGLLTQSALFILTSYVPLIHHVFGAAGEGFAKILSFAGEGARFVFGDLARPAKLGFIFAFIVLPTIVYFSALSALLYHLGLMQRLVAGMAWFMKRSMRLSGPESLTVAGNLFLGHSEAPLLVRPYIRHMNLSELACIMVVGLSTLSGGVLAAIVSMLGGNDPAQQAYFATLLLTASLMNIPAAVAFSKIIFPQTNYDYSVHEQVKADPEKDRSFVSTIVDGALDGARMVSAIASILIAIVALIALFNYLVMDGIGAALGINGLIKASTGGIFDGLTLQYLFGQVFRVFAFLMGISWGESLQVGSLLGQKIVLNEFIAYLDLARLKEAGSLSPQAILISTFALSSFSNLGSVGIFVAAMGALAPNQQQPLATIGLRALLAAVMTGFMTATVTGLWMSIF